MNPVPCKIDLRLRALAIALIVAVMSWLSRHFLLDDALIYARYIRHAVEGRGLIFNTGEPVNALTSILDTWLLLGVCALVKGHILLVEAVFSSAFLVAASLLAERMVPLAGILLAASSFFYFCKGMETTLFILILALCVYAYAGDKIDWLPTLAVLAALTRFEGAAIMPVLVWQLWRTRRLPKVSSFLVPALLVASYFAFNLHFYRHLLPSSASAKLGQGMSGFWGNWPTAFFLVPDIVFRPLAGSWIYFPILIALAWFASKDPRMARWNEIVLPFLAILGAFYILFNIPAYFWYYAPFVYFLTIYAMRLLPETRSVYLATAIVGLCFCEASAVYMHRADIVQTPYVALAQWLNQNTPLDATIASVETGNIGWYCDRHLTDIVGLTTPKNATYTAHRDFSSWFNERPDYIVVHPNLAFPWEKVALASPEYEMLPVHFEGVALLHKKSSGHRP